MATLTKLALGFVYLCWSVSAGWAQPARVEARTQGLEGVNVGVYHPLDLKAQLKAWLARYTMPMMLASVDVAYIYDRKPFCDAPDKPSTSIFFTERFGLALKRSNGYEVNKLLQLQKIDYCKASSSDINQDVVVIGEVKLGTLPLAAVVNWNASETIGGIFPEESDGKTQTVPNPTGHENNIKNLELNKSLLLSYADVLKSNGINVLVGPTRRRDVMALAASSQPLKGESVATQGGSYCMNSPNVSIYPNLGCSDEFGPILRVINAKAVSGPDIFSRIRRSASVASTGEGESWELLIVTPN